MDLMVPSCGIVFTHSEPLSGKFIESLSNYWLLKEDFAYVINLLSMSKIAIRHVHLYKCRVDCVKQK